MKIIRLKCKSFFSFRSTIYSHGWTDLPPFQLQPENLKLKYSFTIDPSDVVFIDLSSDSENDVIININHDLNTKQKKFLIAKVKRMLRFNEDFSEFYEIATKEKDFKWILQFGAGRLLRCASLWEDMVKMLCTTNCTWRLTQIMVENLVNILGENTFPSPQTVANQDEKFLREKIKMGYRAPYLAEFAKKVANGIIHLDDFENWQGTSENLYKELRKIKGFGDYAVGNLMKLLSRYDYMGFDSWNRKQFALKHKNGNNCSDEEITDFYAKFGKWAGLFFWMDVTEKWYQKEQPW